MLVQLINLQSIKGYLTTMGKRMWDKFKIKTQFSFKESDAAYMARSEENLQLGIV